MTRITAPSRLHFGLFRVPGGRDDAQARAFGGVGLMIDLPGVVVSARPADSWRFEGASASRAQVFAHRFMAGLADPRPLHVLVERAPSEHVGLGVGTQLGLAVAKALAVEAGEPGLTAPELAVRVGRGERSAIGVHGFDLGGLVVEPGKAPGEPLSPLLTRVLLPDDWRVAVFAPTVGAHWHGGREREAFARAGAVPRTPGLTDTLCRVALLGMLPAAVGGDLPAFGEALYEFNRLAGEPFAEAQGGPYADPAVEAVVDAVRALGVKGVGQSSWGPSVFAVVGSAAEAAALVKAMPGGARGWVARPSAGHRVERE
jgi:beta-ribofuranosylaminobenzene 5'-phosphate synthase